MFNTQKETNLTNLISENIFNEQSRGRVLNLSKALSHPVRLAILQQLSGAPKSITELAQLNNITNSTAIFHLKLLEDATLVYSKTMPSKKGKTLIFFINFYSIHLFTEKDSASNTEVFTQSLGVGNYIDASFDKYIRIATEEESFILENNDAFDTRRFNAQLICTDNGTFTYAFGNQLFRQKAVEKIEFSFEICSEAPYYRNDWKSEITFAVNGVELVTYLSPGDFGGTRGELNPDWWDDKFTQYGTFVTVAVTNEGVYLNGEKNGATSLKDLKLCQNNRIEFTIFVKKSAKYAGGFNLFGRKFGNHPQDILMKTTVKR